MRGVIRIGIRSFLSWVAVAGVALADPSEDAMAFLTALGAESILPPPGAMEKLWDVAELEPELRSLLARNVLGRPMVVGEEAVFVEPESYHGFSWDLRGNGGKHHFVLDSGNGGSGGYAFVIVSRDDGTWRMVGRVQAASIQLDRDESGESVLVVFGRGGGGNFRRDDHEFVRGAWRVVRSSRFENGKISEVAVQPGASGSLPDPPLERMERPVRRGRPNANPEQPGGRAHAVEPGEPAAQSATGRVGGMGGAWLLATGGILLVGWLLRRVLRATESG
jgi:hypothetical protein